MYYRIHLKEWISDTCNNATTWTDLKNRLNEISQTQKGSYYITPHTWGIQNTEREKVEQKLPGAAERRGRELMFNDYS